MAHVVVVGAGIVGLAVAARLTGDGHQVTVLEKERAVAVHQTGRNSGVIHSGLYYAPGSLKATMAVAGARSMARYARERGVAVEITGKLVVASTPDQVAGLHRLAERAVANGVPGAAGRGDGRPRARAARRVRRRPVGREHGDRGLHRRLPAPSAADVSDGGGQVRSAPG